VQGERQLWPRFGKAVRVEPIGDWRARPERQLFLSSQQEGPLRVIDQTNGTEPWL